MKKIKILAYFAVAITMLAACNSRESMIKDYEKACENGNAIKAGKILEEMGTKYQESEFTEDDIERIEKATLVLDEKALEGMSDMFKALGE